MINYIHCPRRSGKVTATILLLRLFSQAICFVGDERIKSYYPDDVQEQLISVQDLIKRGLHIQ